MPMTSVATMPPPLAQAGTTAGQSLAAANPTVTSDAEQRTADPAERGQQQRLGEELDADLPAGGAEGAAQADLRRGVPAPR